MKLNGFSVAMNSSLLSLFLFSSVITSSAFVLPNYSKKKFSSVDFAVYSMLYECNIGPKNFIFYDERNSDLASHLSMSRTSLKSWILPPRVELDTTVTKKLNNLAAIDGYVVVLPAREGFGQLLFTMVHLWQCSKECTVIVVSKPPNFCNSTIVSTVFRILGYSHFDTYVVCASKQGAVSIFTLDEYGDSRPPGWQKLNWRRTSAYQWSFYIRRVGKDFCHNFNFNRTDPKDDMRIVVGIFHKSRKGASDIFVKGKTVDLIRKGIIIERHEFLERAMKSKFTYYIISRGFVDGNDHNVISSLAKTPIDVFGDSYLLYNISFVAPSFPILYDSCIIVSHVPRLASPLEKISRFYGIWTLSSLIVILSITFTVLYLKTKRNANSAAFDCLRLLINSGIDTPINTLSLKIFFCMVFLYFTVIHATFSGNLPKFLTIPQPYDRINEFKDLANPRISTIYDSCYFHESQEVVQDITRKMQISPSRKISSDKFMKNKSSVLITFKSISSQYMSEKKLALKFNLGKENLRITMLASLYRLRFPFAEEFNRAMVYIFDTQLVEQVEKEKSIIQRSLEKQLILSEIEFRNIAIDDLMFAFVFLSIGNTVAFICFLIELMIGRKYLRKISFQSLKALIFFKSRKRRLNVRRIVVQPK